MARQPVAGVAVWAHTGRGLLLTPGERRILLRSWREGLGPGRVVIAGAGALPTEPDYESAAVRMAEQAAELGADALLCFPPLPHRGDPAAIAGYHRELAAAGLPLLPFLLYEAAGGVAYDSETLRRLFALPGVAGIKMATLDSVVTFQEVASLLREEFPGTLLITGEDRFLGYSLLAGAESALIGMAAAVPAPQAALVSLPPEARPSRFLALTRAVDRFARATFRPPMEGYVQRMLWALTATGVLPEEAAFDPHGPSLEPWEKERVEREARRLEEVPVEAEPAPSDQGKARGGPKSHGAAAGGGRSGEGRWRRQGS